MTPFSLRRLPDDKLQLIVAIADPTAWIAEGSKLDKAAKIRAFTNYLPASTSLYAASRAF